MALILTQQEVVEQRQVCQPHGITVYQEKIQCYLGNGRVFDFRNVNISVYCFVILNYERIQTCRITLVFEILSPELELSRLRSNRKR